jgi:Ni,Fe-hydrogenase III small subunit
MTTAPLVLEESPARLGPRLRDAIARVLGGSLHIRHLDAGSCNGCDWEIQALLNPIYDLLLLGSDFVASPRHAVLLLVTGTVTRNLAAAVRATYEATPAPKLVVAVGACACSGGIFHDSYAGASACGVDQIIPVDVYIPGNPPRPSAIIHGLLLALGKREQQMARIELTRAE